MPLPDERLDLTSWWARRRQADVDRAARRAFDRLADDPESRRRHPSRAGAVALAVVVVTVFLGMLAGSLWISLPPHAWWQWPVLVFDALVLLMMRPRKAGLARRGRVLPPAGFPGVHGLVGHLAEQMDVVAPRTIALSYDLNAWVQRYGWGNGKAMVIGLPLWTTGTPEERCAVLAHELGHLGHRDLDARRVVSTARRLVGGIVYTLGSDAPDPLGRNAVQTRLANLVQAGQSVPFRLLALWLARLDAAASQHDEYLADRRAAAIAGTEAARRMLAIDTVGLWTRTASATRRGVDPWEELARVPASDDERIAAHVRRSQQATLRANASHPPDHLRITLLETAYQPPAHLPPTELMAAAEREIAQLREVMRRGMVEALQRVYYND